MADSSGKNVLFNYEGCNFLRQRIILSVLSGKSIKIKKIRKSEDDPGVKDFERNFLDLIEKVTNGTRVEINTTGTSLYFQPGMLMGGSINHECSTERSIGYYLEPLLIISPFMKEPLNAKLTGVTNDQYDFSPDLLKSTMLPVLKRFVGTDEGLSIRVTRRGPAPDGGGEVIVNCPCRQKLRPLQLTEVGKVKRIRGIAWGCRVAPNICNRMIDSARGILNKFIPDVYIYSDHAKGRKSGSSPGFGMALVAETNNEIFYGAELISEPKGSDKGPTVPEDLGENCAKCLVDEIYRGGCVDSSSQALTCVLLALGEQNVSKVCTGPLSPYSIGMLRHIRDFFQVIFKFDKLKTDEDCDLKTGGDKLLLTCVGVGFTNLSKATL